MPAERTRVLTVLAVALLAVSCLLARALTCDDPLNVGADLHHTVEGARRLAAGENIYVTHPRVPDEITGTFSTGEYPFPAYLVAWAFAYFPPLLGSALWVFVTTCLLAWLLTARGWSRLWILASYPFVKAVSVAQWEPLLLCGMLAPWASVFLLCKPQSGLPILAAFPDRRRWASVAAGIAVSLLLWPSWPLQWLHSLPAIPGVHGQKVAATFGEYEMLILRPGGFLVLLALLRWRDWRARLFVAMACMPQALTYHHQMLFLMIPQTRSRVLLLNALTWLGAGIWAFGRWQQDWAMAWNWGAATCLALYWLPCLLFILNPVPED